jgi:hypothetical protein
MKEAVQLAMQQNPQRLIARLTVNERREDIARRPFSGGRCGRGIFLELVQHATDTPLPGQA